MLYHERITVQPDGLCSGKVPPDFTEDANSITPAPFSFTVPINMNEKSS